MPEMTEDRLTEIIQRACDQSAEKSESRVLKMFGLPDNDEGRKILLDVGGSFKTLGDVKQEMRTQSIRGTVRFVLTMIKAFIIGFAVFLGYKLGLLERFIK